MRAFHRFGFGTGFEEGLKTGIGLTALAATLLLASPGVKVVRAEDATGRPAANQCSVDPQPTADVQVILSDLAGRKAMRRGSVEGGADIVVLNNRGYNYGPDPAMNLDPARVETDRSPRR